MTNPKQILSVMSCPRSWKYDLRSRRFEIGPVPCDEFRSVRHGCRGAERVPFGPRIWDMRSCTCQGGGIDGQCALSELGQHMEIHPDPKQSPCQASCRSTRNTPTSYSIRVNAGKKMVAASLPVIHAATLAPALPSPRLRNSEITFASGRKSGTNRA